jgi:hypothetical protein
MRLETDWKLNLSQSRSNDLIFMKNKSIERFIHSVNEISMSIDRLSTDSSISSKQLSF